MSLYKMSAYSSDGTGDLCLFLYMAVVLGLYGMNIAGDQYTV